MNICSIKGCIEKKHIGFINLDTGEKYYLCRKHDAEWIRTNLEVPLFILKKNIEQDKEQMRLT